MIGFIIGLKCVCYIDFLGNFCKFIVKFFFIFFVGLEILNFFNNVLLKMFESDENGDFF